MNGKITKIYFSPTGNTKKSVDAMAAAIGSEFQDYDVTVERDTAQHVFAPTDFAIIGAPVYGGRIPKVAAARFARFQGNQTPCIVVVTYGNRHYDDALLELSDLAAAQGFVVRGAAALVGRHTFGEVQVDRPDSNDLAADEAFARKAAENQNTGNLAISGNRPYKEGGGAAVSARGPPTNASRASFAKKNALCRPLGRISKPSATAASHASAVFGFARRERKI
jgi:protein involved in ribonucleotide reduction